MGFIQRMGVAKRISFMMAVVLVLSAGLVGFSLWVVSGQQALIDNLGKVQADKIRLSQRWDANIREAVARWNSVAFSSDPELFKQTREATLAISTDTNEVQKRMLELEDSAEGKRIVEEMNRARAIWLASRDKVRAAIEASDFAKASELGMGEFAQVSTAYKAVSARYAAYQVTDAARESEAASATTRRFVTILTGLLVLLVLVTVFLAWRLTTSIVRPLQDAVQAAQAIAQGDLTNHLEATGNDEPSQVIRAMSEMQQALSALVSRVKSSTDSIEVAASEVATGNMDLSNRTEQTASNLQQASASMGEIASSVSTNADNARQAQSLASEASTVAVRGGEAVAQVVSTMRDIATSSQKINDIIGTIDGIAFQTNILALNAAVEAARAGEQGRGFAVVASEVRALAQRSASAAKEIKTLIADSTQRVSSGSALVEQAGNTMDEVVGSVQRVSQLIGDIAAATTEQSQGVAHVNSSVGALDQMTQQNAALVEESAAAASSLKEQADQLAAAIGVFRLSGATGARRSPPALGHKG